MFMDKFAAFYKTQGFAPLFVERAVTLGQAAQQHTYLEVVPLDIGMLVC